MLTNEEIKKIGDKSRDAYEFAQACYMAGMRERQRIDVLREAGYPLSPVIGRAIGDLIAEAQ